MYRAIEPWYGQRAIFSNTMSVVDSERRPEQTPSRFGRVATPPPTIRGVGLPTPGSVEAGMGTPPPTYTPRSSNTQNGTRRTSGTPGDNEPGSTGRKRKQAGTNNLVDFVKDFNNDYMGRVELQEVERRQWRQSMFAFESDRENRLAAKDAQSATLEEKLYQLEQQKTTNLGNMTNAMMLMASISRHYLSHYVIYS